MLTRAFNHCHNRCRHWHQDSHSCIHPMFKDIYGCKGKDGTFGMYIDAVMWMSISYLGCASYQMEQPETSG
jgi:hypothetical protein